MKPLRRATLAAAVALLGLGLLFVSSAGQLAAQETSLSHGSESAAGDLASDPIIIPPDPGEAVVAKISGLLDPVLADFLSDSLKEAQADNAVLFVLQIDSRGAVISDSRLQQLADELASSTVPVVAWIGPSGAKAYGKVAQLASHTQRIGIAPGARLGRTGPDVLSGSAATAATSHFSGHEQHLHNSSVSASQALELGITSFDAPTIGDFLVNLDDLGFQSEIIENEGEDPRLEPQTKVQFVRLTFLDQLFHTVASPAMAYVLLLVGLWLFAFEFFSAGVGIAGATGAVSLLLASYGLATLPFAWWALALLALAMLAYCIDAQAGVPRFWTAVGTGALIAGSLTLYDGTNGVDMSWIPISLGVLGVAVGMVWVMPVVIRSRFSTPTIGREWMIGETGEAIEAIDPDGIIKVRGTLWRARTRRAVTIAPGEKAVVEELLGLTLMVEPEETASESDADTDTAEELATT